MRVTLPWYNIPSVQQTDGHVLSCKRRYYVVCVHCTLYTVSTTFATSKITLYLSKWKSFRSCIYICIDPSHVDSFETHLQNLYPDIKWEVSSGTSMNYLNLTVNWVWNQKYGIEGRYNWRGSPYHMIMRALQTSTPFV